MKVALISTFCLESSFPLAKNIQENGSDIHLFGIVPIKNQDLYVVNFSENEQPIGFINNEIINAILGYQLLNYLKNIKMFFYVIHGSGRKHIISDLYNCWKLSAFIKKEKFDIVHLVHTYGRISLFLLYFLRKQNVVQTLHEVTSHSGETSKIDFLILKFLAKKNIPLIFHSIISKNRFLTFKDTIGKTTTFDNDLYIVIKFGLFETYKLFDFKCENKISNSRCDIPIVLHFGRILPYKGIDILIEAIKLVQKVIPVHLIIAGSGSPYFSFQGLNSFEFINRNLSNTEITHLIKISNIVVCPYKSASQSGIPMTVFVFNKPIIASNVGGFNEVIDDGKNGNLINSLYPIDFSSSILNILLDNDLNSTIKDNIKNKFEQGEYSWRQIAQQTINFYEKSIFTKNQ